MFAKNVGTIDRALRIIVGAGLIAGYFVNPGHAYSWLYLLGVIPLATGLLSTCPAYSIFGIRTCKTSK